MLNHILISSSILCVLLLAPHQHCYAVNNIAQIHKLRPFRAENFVTEEVTFAAQTVPAGSQNVLKEKDKIDRLPGQPDRVEINQYSGYVTIDPRKGKTLFYYFVESWNDASSKPLVLWFNAEPLCSAVGIGAFTEIGPFLVGTDRKTLYLNEYAWNREANILFVDLAVGIGFSHSHTNSDYKRIGDNIIANDIYTFLCNWLERFPEYRNRDLFLVGEDYLPATIGQFIFQETKYPDHLELNFKGIALGNAYIDSGTYGDGWMDFLWSHALISDEIYHGLKSNCNFTANHPFSDKCLKYVDMQYNVTDGINRFNIYAPLCNSSPGGNRSPLKAPCLVRYLSDYFGNPTVQIAFHSTIDNTLRPWKRCSDGFESWIDVSETMLPVITELMQEGIQIWLYSGDGDSYNNPITSTRYAINKLGISITVPWYPWYYKEKVAGYAVGYENLTFVSVKGAGAFVPDSRPTTALALFASFLKGKLPPSK